jgi:hypothetical protein
MPGRCSQLKRQKYLQQDIMGFSEGYKQCADADVLSESPSLLQSESGTDIRKHTH